MESNYSLNTDFGDWLDGTDGELDEGLEGIDLDDLDEDSSFADLASKRMTRELFPELAPKLETLSSEDGIDDNPLANEVYSIDALLDQEETLDDAEDFEDLLEDLLEDLPEEDSPVEIVPLVSITHSPVISPTFVPLGVAPVQEVNDDLALEVLEEVESTTTADVIEYPCMVIDGLTTVEEAQFLNRMKPSSEMVLPLYCSIDGTIKRIGTSELTIKYLQILNYLGDYCVSIRKAESVASSLDLKDVNTYLRLITL